MSTFAPLNIEKSTMPEDLIEDGMVEIKSHFKHSWWRILLILLAVIASIVTFALSLLAGSGLKGIFTQRTGGVSDQNPTDFTPASWTFVFWFMTFIWQTTWLIFALIGIPRKSNVGYLYIQPNIFHYSILIFYIFNMGLNIGWLILWDRTYFGWSLLVIFFMFLTIINPTIIIHTLVQRNRPSYINSNRIRNIWFAGIYVNNIFVIHGTWLYLVTLLNLTVWISQIYNRNTQSITDASTAAFSLLLVTIVIYFICENLIFFSSMAYVSSPWFVLILFLSGIISKNYNRTDISDRNKFFALALLIICCVLFCARVVLLIIHYKKQKTQINRES